MVGMRISTGGFARRSPESEAVKNLIDLGSEHEIAPREPIDLVRPDRHGHLPPGQVDVGVMSFPLGDRADSVRERESLSEVRRTKLLLEMMFLDDPPAGAKLGCDGLQLIATHRGYSTAAWNTAFGGQRGNAASSPDVVGELLRVHTMAERFNPVDLDDRNVVGVTRSEARRVGRGWWGARG